MPGWIFFRLYEHTNAREKQEYFNPGWNQKHHLHCSYTTWFINEDHCSKSYQLIICLTFTIVITKFWGVFEVLKMKRQKYMGKIVLALSSTLTTCLLLLWCYCSASLFLQRYFLFHIQHGFIRKKLLLNIQKLFISN